MPRWIKHRSDLPPFVYHPIAQNQAHDSVIANELMLTDPRSPHDPSLNSPRRLFTYSSATTHNTMHFDSPSRQIYAPTPVSQESRNILLSPRKGQRAISRVPFKVLDAPDLKVPYTLPHMEFLAVVVGKRKAMSCLDSNTRSSFDSTLNRMISTSTLWIGLPKMCLELVWVAVSISGAQQQEMCTNFVMLEAPTLSLLSAGPDR